MIGWERGRLVRTARAARSVIDRRRLPTCIYALATASGSVPFITIKFGRKHRID